MPPEEVPRDSLESLRRSLEDAAPPPGLPLALAALWWSARGDWDAAHELAQRDERPACAWVHAHLHRAEGDLANASYWYRRAGRERPHGALEEEWEAIARVLLAEGGE